MIERRESLMMMMMKIMTMHRVILSEWYSILLILLRNKLKVSHSIRILMLNKERVVKALQLTQIKFNDESSTSFLLLYFKEKQ